MGFGPRAIRSPRRFTTHADARRSCTVSAGGLASGPNAGDGRQNPFKDSLVRPLPISPSEQTDLVEFLEALTDETFLRDPRLGPPAD